MRNMAPPGNVSSARKEGSPTLCQRRHRFAQCRLPRPQQTKAASCHCQPHDATATRSRSTSPVVGRIPPHSTRSLPIFGDRFFASVHWLSCPCFPVATSAPAVPASTAIATAEATGRPAWLSHAAAKPTSRHVVLAGLRRRVRSGVFRWLHRLLLERSLHLARPGKGPRRDGRRRSCLPRVEGKRDHQALPNRDLGHGFAP